MPFINISAPSIVSGMSGESEKTLRETFEDAKVGRSALPAVAVDNDSLLGRIALGAVHSVYRRGRCDHSKERERSEGNGETNSRAVPHLHGW